MKAKAIIEDNKPRWQSQYNRTAFRTKGEVNDQPSMTTPDMAMTIEEIIARSTRGLKMEHMLRVPIYEGNINDSDDQVVAKYIPDVLNMDPVDQQAYKTMIDKQVDVAKKRIAAAHKINQDLKRKLARLKDEETEVEDNEDNEDEQPTPPPAKSKSKGKGAKG